MPYFGGRVSVSSATFTPAAASHAAGTTVGAPAEFKGVAQSSGAGVQIISASLLVASATLITATFRLYLYNVTPPSAQADGATFNLVSGDRASFIGYVDIAQLVDAGDTLYIQSDNLNKGIKLASRSCFGVLTVLTGTPTTAAVAHTATLWTVGS